MSAILVLQHIACETLGLIEDLLTAQNMSFRYVRSFAGEAVPSNIGDSPALIVLGGPMSVYEADLYPFLKHEMNLIRSALDAQRPVLGICLGSQLLAEVLGSSVRKGSRKEIGWHPVFFSSQAREDRLLSKTDEGIVLHWHGDIFDLPSGAVPLASSDRTQIQAFRHGDNVYGLLFHLEITEEMVRDWVSEFSGELSEEQIDPEQILSGMHKYLPGLRAMGRRVFGNWVEVVCG